MEFTILIWLVVFVVRVLTRELRKPEAYGVVSVRTSLCRECTYAHIARGFRTRDELIACTYGGAVRRVKFAVSECSMFCNRNANAPLVRIVGFAETIGDQSVGPAIAAQASE